MLVCCLDLEGVLVPEIWIAVARRTGIDALKLTTRDISDYDRLMRHRIGILKKQRIPLCEVQAVIRRMRPLAGAVHFLNHLRRRCPVILLSDTYDEFAGPLLEKLGRPVLFCNRLRVDRAGFISGYTLRQKDGKTKAVRNLKRMGFRVHAAGDSHNDLGMLRAADRAVLFRPPESIRKARLRFPVARDHDTLLRLLTAE